MTKRIRIHGERRPQPDVKKLVHALLMLATEWAKAEDAEPKPAEEPKGRRR